ncbi:MAG: hypothetical protein M3364_06210, partial [Actinomycetota bacterium]|nr:hypothetical protein [Actinomycetota bacterium]
MRRVHRLGKRVNVSGWLLVVLMALLAEAAIQLFELHDTVSPPLETLPALWDGITSGELSGALRT